MRGRQLSHSGRRGTAGGPSFVNVRTTGTSFGVHRSSAGRTGGGLHASLGLGDRNRTQDRTQTCPKAPRGLWTALAAGPAARLLLDRASVSPDCRNCGYRGRVVGNCPLVPELQWRLASSLGLLEPARVGSRRQLEPAPVGSRRLHEQAADLRRPILRYPARHLQVDHAHGCQRGRVEQPRHAPSGVHGAEQRLRTNRRRRPERVPARRSTTG